MTDQHHYLWIKSLTSNLIASLSVSTWPLTLFHSCGDRSYFSYHSRLAHFILSVSRQDMNSRSYINFSVWSFSQTAFRISMVHNSICCDSSKSCQPMRSLPPTPECPAMNMKATFSSPNLFTNSSHCLFRGKNITPHSTNCDGLSFNRGRWFLLILSLCVAVQSLCACPFEHTQVSETWNPKMWKGNTEVTRSNGLNKNIRKEQCDDYNNK